MPPLPPELSDDFLPEGEWIGVYETRNWKNAVLSFGRENQFRLTFRDKDDVAKKYSGKFQVYDASLPTLGDTKALRIDFGRNAEDSSFPYSTRSLYFDTTQHILTDLTSMVFTPQAMVEVARERYAESQQRLKDLPKEPTPGRWHLVWEKLFDEEGNDADVAISDFANFSGLIATASEDSYVILDHKGGERYRINNAFDMEAMEMGGSKVVWGMKENRPMLVTFGSWICPIKAIRLDGTCDWTHRPEDGVDCVSTVVTTEGHTMILVGLNGHGGIQIIDPSDWTIRCVEGPGNVWSIAPARVATSPPYGFVAVDGWEAVTYCISGNVIASCDSYTELRHLHCVDLDDDGEDEIVAIGSMFGIGEILSAFRRDGELMWATRLKDSGFHLDSPLFTLTVDLVQMVAVASQHGVTFFSTMGEQLDHFQIAITGAAPLKTKSTSDRLVLRGHGFLSCYEIEPSGSEGL